MSFDGNEYRRLDLSPRMTVVTVEGGTYALWTR